MLELFSANNFLLLFQLLYALTALGVTIVIITENRHPLKTISWVLVLLFLPLIGLVIYYFFGEDRRKRRMISHRMMKKLRKQSLRQIGPSTPSAVPEEYQGLANLIQNLKGSVLYDSNKITFYSDGSAKFSALIDELERAKVFIHIQYYIFEDDSIGGVIRDILVRKAKEGVEVRLIYDDVGCWKTKRRFFRDMQQQGVEVQPFLKVAFRYVAGRVNYRNHRKIVVIDGEIGFIGGMNIADRYINGTKYGIWRDSHIKVEGKAVAGLQASFVIDWYYSRKEFLSEKKYFPVIESSGNNLMQIAVSGPFGSLKGIHLGIIQAIYDAKQSVYIQTPYFVPTEHLLLAMQTAAARGVDVRLMIPRHSDTTFVHLATKGYLRDVMKVGVQVYSFEIGFLHSKLMVVDDNLTITGSANMDARSFEHNFEIDAFVYDRETNHIATNIFMDDAANSSLLILDEWECRPRMQKFSESFVRMFSPLL